MDEEQKKLLRDAVGPFQKEGETEISGQIIKLPLGYKGPAKLNPMDYEMVDIQESDTDYFPHLEGVCMLAAVQMTPKKINVPIAFKKNGDKSPYKILH